MNHIFILSGAVSKSYGKDIIQIIYILILCLVIFLGAYYSSKIIGNAQFKKSKNSNIRIIEAVAVGTQKSIQLIKIGEKFFLIGVTKDRITFLKDVNEEDIDLNLLNNSDIGIPFSKYMNKLKKK